MNDTAVVTTDLDRLAERVERAATLVLDLRAKNAQLDSKANQFEAQVKDLETKRAQLEAQTTQLQTQLTDLESTKGQLSAKGDEFEKQLSLLGQQRDVLEQKLAETLTKLQGQDPTALLGELAALKKEQREWTNERKEVAARIEAISTKLERIE